MSKVVKGLISAVTSLLGGGEAPKPEKTPTAPGSDPEKARIEAEKRARMRKGKRADTALRDDSNKLG